MHGEDWLAPVPVMGGGGGAGAPGTSSMASPPLPLHPCHASHQPSYAAITFMNAPPEWARREGIVLHHHSMMPRCVCCAWPTHAARRSAGRFVGTEPEPRPGLRGGHIPGAQSLPFVSLLKDGRYKPAAELQAAFDAAGLDLAKPIVGSCGTGLTACVLALAAYQLTGKLVRGVGRGGAGRGAVHPLALQNMHALRCAAAPWQSDERVHATRAAPAPRHSCHTQGV